ncbi:hypothetical protein CAAN3_06S07624 [[Candida] anglica]
MEGDIVRSGDETELPSSAVSTDKSSDSEPEHHHKRSLEEASGSDIAGPKKLKLESVSEHVIGSSETAHDLFDDIWTTVPSNRSDEGEDMEENNDENDEINKQYKKFTSAPKFNLNSEEVFCICRKPDHGGELMISCDGCDEWFHFKCMNLNAKYSSLISKFFCKFCRWKETGRTRWKRKCRLPSCYQPVRTEINSKYCSEECGIKFISINLISRSSEYDIKPELVSSVLTHCTENQDEPHKKLLQLGTTFPELPEVVALQENPKDLTKFTLKVQKELEKINNAIEIVLALIDVYNIKDAYLARIREKTKVINEKLTHSEEVDDTLTTKKSKSKKPKKFDLCGYDKDLNTEHKTWMKYFEQNKPQIQKLVNSENIYEDFKDQVDEVIRFYNDQERDDIWFQGNICLAEKRKCLRHGGWWNLVQDDVSRQIDEFSSELQDLEKDRSIILRDYSVNIFEQ